MKTPGDYSVSCTLGASTKSASFSIAAPDAAPTLTLVPAAVSPTSTPDGGVALPTLGQFTAGGMWFYFDQATTSIADYFLQHCLPGVNYNDEGGWDYFSVAADGVLTGECKLNYGDYAQYTGLLTQGQWTADGQVTFTLETSIVTTTDSGTSTNKVVWVGTGQFTSATSATGTAIWTGICQTSSPDSTPCGRAEYGSEVQATGTIPWVINFYP